MQSLRTRVFWIQILYLLVLGAVAWLYFTSSLPAWLTDPTKVGLTTPPAVLFFGALGGVLASLAGVFEHMRDWDDRYFFWHIARPAVGAVSAVIAVLTFEAGILAVGVQPTDASSGTKNLFFYVVAFVVGYREMSFREMIKKAADLLFTSSGDGSATSNTPTGIAAAPVITSIEPDHGPLAGGTSVKISGKGLAETEFVLIGAENATFSVSSDVEITVTAPPAAVPSRVSVTLLTSRRAVVAGQLYEYQ